MLAVGVAKREKEMLVGADFYKHGTPTEFKKGGSEGNVAVESEDFDDLSLLRSGSFQTGIGALQNTQRGRLRSCSG
ncbi:MAG: hypothetical protein JWQ71_4975 [Pedosphaera sp.]|nr:hypothetical protein [Pedosphaera sp.]